MQCESCLFWPGPNTDLEVGRSTIPASEMWRTAKPKSDCRQVLPKRHPPIVILAVAHAKATLDMEFTGNYILDRSQAASLDDGSV